MIELAAYSFLAALAMALANARLGATGRHTLTWTLLALPLSLIVRLSGFDTDINVYASQMHETSLGFYYLREPVVWLTHRLLYYLWHDEVIVLVITDQILMFFVFLAFGRLRLPPYAYVSILLYFPFILGFQNVYRQWAAACFFMMAVSSATQNRKLSLIYLLASALSHNVALLFWPAVLALKKSHWRGIVTAIMLVMVPIAVFFGADGKSELDSGPNLVTAYLLVLLAMTAFCSLYLVQLGAIRDKTQLRLSMFMCVYATIWASILLTPVPAERFAMFNMIVLSPFLFTAIEQTGRFKKLFRMVFIVTGFMPIVLFPTRHFITSGI